jgi:DNA-binding transcriptional ArsR family regulator
MRAPALVILAAAIVAFAGTATATSAPAQFAITGGAPARLGGEVRAEAPTGVLRFDEAPAAMRLSGSVRVGSSGDLLGLPVPLTDHAGDIAFEPGPAFEAWMQGTSLALTTASPKPPTADAWQHANAQVGVLLHDHALGSGFAPLTAGAFEVRARDATATLELQRMVVRDAVLTIGTARITAPPSGLVLEADTAALHIEAPTATLLAHQLLVRLDGTFALAWADGTIDAPQHRGPVRDQLVLDGQLDLRPLGVDLDGAPAIAWFGAGTLRAVLLGPAPAPAPVADAATVTLGAGAALGLAAATAYYWPSLRCGLLGILAPLYARVPRDRVLDHAARELVYERIRTEPGVSTHKLAAGVDFGWSTLAYHLRVLERNQLIVSVRDGRYKRFFDRQSGAYANGRKHLVAVLKNETTLALARAVLDQPGVTQKTLSERFQLSPSSVHWHIERLSEAQLLEKRRDGHNVRYHPGQAWTDVRMEDVAPRPTTSLSVALP